MENYILILLGICFGVYFIYLQEQWFFKRTNEHYCRKYNGNCNYCDCWSCEKYCILHEKK